MRAAAVTRVVFLVPRREDGGHRDRLWAVCRQRWERLFPDWPVYEGHHLADEGPWNRARAVNRAGALAGDWDVGIVIDADVMVDREQAAEAARKAAEAGKVTWAHYGWRELHRETTEALLADPAPVMQPDLDIPSSWVRKSTPISWSCVMAVPRKVWDALGGMDERFEGWGGEDTAFAAAVQGMHGWSRVEGVVTNLWHDPSGRQPRTREYVQNMRLRDRYAMALRRDHWMHDRVDQVDAAEHRRDMENIKRASRHDARSKVCYCDSCARDYGLPDWSGWWPTLPELISRKMPEPSVALLVHSGGDPLTWRERSRYLRRSLASYSQRLQLERWERRVVISDWGDTFRDELERIAAEYGFYVKGPERRLGYTESMRWMWRYIARHVKAEYVFQAEDDFTVDRDVDVVAMAQVMSGHLHLVQMALLRPPLSERESQPGTLLGQPVVSYQVWPEHLEHRHFFTCNPGLMRTSLAIREPWPEGPHSEAVYGRRLFRNASTRAGLWGDGTPWITHLGETRAGGPY